jgi:ankyrin repeat protein
VLVAVPATTVLELQDEAASPSSSSSSSSTSPSSSSSASATHGPADDVSPQLAAQYQRVLRQAVRSGDCLGLRRLLEARQGRINVNALDAEGQTALHETCQLGNLELVKLLVRFGADVQLANRDGWSAVHIAAFGGHTDILLFLMQAVNLALRRS